ncbi:unnamed protein product [Brachionus calyciflorus]|uniref:Uncharacterized protein n=1 Tax=Brachionus calyciflorus TaxID=104777 RepID=A0A813RU84_9BILA|nr:unnamed protein product [Brachionus calyciflorus]
MITQPFPTPGVPIPQRKRTLFDRAFHRFSIAYFLSFLFFLFTIVYFVIEVARIFTGSLNRSAQFSYMLYPGNIYLPPNFNVESGVNIERQHHYLWPWSHPSLLLTIPMLLAAIFGLSAARRATYSMIYLFFTFSLFVFFMSWFLIGYFSSIINRHNRGATNYKTFAPANRDRSLSIVMIIFTLLIFLLSLISSIITALYFGCCKTKGGGYLRSPRRHSYVPLDNVVPAISPNY